MYMWRDWRTESVERELAALAKNGVEVMRVFPLWNDFQPLTRVHGVANTSCGFLQADGPFQNAAGVDGEMMRRFRTFCDMAQKNDIRLVVGLITGWMSGRMFQPPAFDERNALTDPEAIMWRRASSDTSYGKCAIIRRSWRGISAMSATAMGKATNAEFYNWMNALGSTIRQEDPTRPVGVRLHGMSTMEKYGSSNPSGERTFPML